jgi:hypothetical protein
MIWRHSSAPQKAAAAADRASQDAARLREQLAGLQRAVDAANPTAATTAASQVCKTQSTVGWQAATAASSCQVQQRCHDHWRRRPEAAGVQAAELARAVCVSDLRR